MFDWEAAIEEEKEGISKYEQAAKEMDEKYPKKLYGLQFRIMAEQEAKHQRALQKMWNELKNDTAV